MTEHRAISIRTALRYRIRGERRWYEGLTEIISSSDLLFRGDRLMEPGTPVEMTFTLPLELAGDAGVKVMCHGITADSGEFPMIAVKLFHSRLLRP